MTPCGICRGSAMRPATGTNGGAGVAWPNNPARTPAAKTLSRYRSGGPRYADQAKALPGGGEWRPAGRPGPVPAPRPACRTRPATPARMPSRLPPNGRAGSARCRVLTRRPVVGPEAAASGDPSHQLGADCARPWLPAAARPASPRVAAADTTLASPKAPCTRRAQQGDRIDPGWCQKRRSSTAISRSVSSGGAVSERKRQTPPSAGRSASGRPWRSRTSLPMEERRERSGGKA